MTNKEGSSSCIADPSLPIEVAAGIKDGLWVEVARCLEKGLVFADEPGIAEKIKFAHRELIDPDLFRIPTTPGEYHYYRFRINVGEKTYHLKFYLAEEIKPVVNYQLNRVVDQLDKAINEQTRVGLEEEYNYTIFINRVLIRPCEHLVRIRPVENSLFGILSQVLNPPIEEINHPIKIIKQEGLQFRIYPTRLSANGLYWWSTMVSTERKDEIRLRYDLAVLNTRAQQVLFLGS